MTDSERINQELERDDASPRNGISLMAESLPPAGLVAVNAAATQWAVMGNGCYRPSTRTVAAAPPGSYAIEGDDRGLYLRAQALLTDRIVALPDSVSLRAVGRARKFWQSQARYLAHGLLFRTGMLFFGPPGSGKSCTIHSIVGELTAMGGISLFCSHPEWMKSMLVSIRLIEPERPLIVVMEDLDELIRVHGENNILSVLDGENRVANVIMMATTNYVGRLGARIVNRPARFDERFYIGMPSRKDRVAYLWFAAPDLSAAENDRWAADTAGLSIAHLRELVAAVLCLEQDYADVLERLKSMMEMPREKDNEGFAHRPMGLVT